jgi:hypothetical protein
MIKQIFLCFIVVCLSFLYFSCDDDTGNKKITNVTNNTVEEKNYPDLMYQDVSAILESNVSMIEVCQNNQVMYVVTSTIIKNGKKHTQTEKQMILNVMYKLDEYGRPIQCGIE